MGRYRAMNRSDMEASSSKFAWLTAPGLHARPAHDVVVASNNHFVAVPSLGSLVPGWILLIPRRPMSTLSLMDTEERKALAVLRTELAARLSAYGHTVHAFEHGGASGSLVSCGVDQAHLHLVPLSFDLLHAARRHDLGWRTSVGIRDLTEAETGGKEYLFVERLGVSLIGFPETPTSQWFRRLIAQECGGREWDYKKNPNFEQLEATVAKLTAPRSAISI
ncbi:HIT domain-containing protein [Mesorhizobium sp. M1322]|uniref:HIT family protein n=1 Tax=Mesorhizobium sp. M1322 TaxID=2957081 RepID=UPI003335DF58